MDIALVAMIVFVAFAVLLGAGRGQIAKGSIRRWQMERCY